MWNWGDLANGTSKKRWTRGKKGSWVKTWFVKICTGQKYQKYTLCIKNLAVFPASIGSQNVFLYLQLTTYEYFSVCWALSTNCPTSRVLCIPLNFLFLILLTHVSATQQCYKTAARKQLSEISHQMEEQDWVDCWWCECRLDLQLVHNVTTNNLH